MDTGDGRARARASSGGASSSGGPPSPNGWPEPSVATPRGERSAARKKTVGAGLGFCHALGLTFLFTVEWLRSRWDSGGTDSLAYLKQIGELAASLSQEEWYRTVADLFDAISLHQPRAALWAAVFIAAVVRLNRHGPEPVQRVLSVITAGYCLIGAVALWPYTAAAGSGFYLMLLVACGLIRLLTW